MKTCDELDLIFGFSFHADQLNTRGVERGRDANLNFLGQQRGFKIGLDDHFDLQLGPANLSDQGNHTEW